MTGPAQGGVIITAADQYQEMKAISSSVNHQGAKLDDHDRRLGEQGKAIGDHENRLRDLERRLWTATGIVAIVSAGASGLITHFITTR